MDSWTLNKIAGAVLGTCVVGMGIGIIAQGIFEPGKPAKPGYALPEPKEAANGGGEKPGVTPIAVRLEKADPKKGEADAKVCSACHNFQEGAGAKVGPDLWNVVDRAKGKEAGFDYSAGMKAKGGDWTYADLDEFLTKPAAYVQGTKMGYPGQEDPEKRADIIAYLHTLSKDPKPLPKVTAADKKEVAQAGGEAKGNGKEGDKGNAGGEAAGEAAFLKQVGAADPKKGQAAAQVCAACHNFRKGAGSLIGPDLWDVVNRKKGSVAGYDYSEGLKKKGGEWTIDDLNAWLTKPASYIPGTKMGYPGESNEKKRAEIIAFLRTLSDHPVALPDTKEGAKKAESDHAGEAKNMPPGAKPGDQRPPAPPAPPGSPQPVPQVPEQSSATAAPETPDERRPDMPAPPPTHDEASPSSPSDKGGKPEHKSEAPAPEPQKAAEADKNAAAPPKQEADSKPASAPAASGASGTGETGPEPYQATDPQDGNSSTAAEQSLPKADSTPPSLTPAGDEGEGNAAGPEPYAAPAPDQGK